MANKNLRISSFDCRYDYESGNIELTSKDKRFRGTPLKLTLSNRTEGYNAIYSLLSSEGLIDIESIPPKMGMGKIEDLELLNVPGRDPRTNFNLGYVGGFSPYSVDLQRTPHMLTVGSAGSGKTVLQRNVMLHALENSDEIELYGIDLEKVELKGFFSSQSDRLATSLEDTHRLLTRLVQIIDERYRLLKESGIANAIDTELPWIYLITDELDELTGRRATSSEEKLRLECLALYLQILKRGRAGGVSVFAATQRADLIPGELLETMGIRIAMGNLHRSSLERTVGPVGKRAGLLNQLGVALASVYGETRAFSTFVFPAEIVEELQRGSKE